VGDDGQEAFALGRQKPWHLEGQYQSEVLEQRGVVAE